MNGQTLQGFDTDIQFQCPLSLVEPRTGLLIKSLPANTTEAEVFDRFVSFGPIYSCSIISKASSAEVTATVQFFLQQDAHMALQEMDNVSVPSPIAVHSPQQQQYIDYCNLYIKNLDEAITSTDLFQHFKTYGRIVSARVIVNAATNQSRGYGFVSYSRPEEAAYALNQMNGTVLGSKPIMVAYHEPKKPRVLPVSPKSPGVSETGSQPASISSVSSSGTSSPVPQVISLTPLASPPTNTGSSDTISQRLGGQDGASTPGSTVSDQRDKMIGAIHQIEPTAGDEIIDMLMTLSSKERSLCIFNPEYLRTKINQARNALDIFADEDGSSDLKPTSHQPKIKEDDNAEAFYLKIANLSLFEQKQKLGDKLYPLVKATGVKQAPKVTIQLLDTVDLHRLSRLMTVDNPELSSLAKTAFESL
ncbi:hypothetical protein BGW37DRAFT_427478 [Umbelopsis sp. PMI_123]|nr:hypothetical protein BGW37DRAFT_427478 [Umbelopsis sp. PMI_123]